MGRMTLNVKHYDNGGGACALRDKKGKEEKRNIEILQTKWPGVFRPNPKRRNEVIMRGKKAGGDIAEEEDEHDDSPQANGGGAGRRAGRTTRTAMKRPASAEKVQRARKRGRCQ